KRSCHTFAGIQRTNCPIVRLTVLASTAVIQPQGYSSGSRPIEMESQLKVILEVQVSVVSFSSLVVAAYYRSRI
ncbi:uncharacterized protein PGTG_20432, partial [Puccinia graminis f. sp. tritici CRL 75-36-700-3]